MLDLARDDGSALETLILSLGSQAADQGLFRDLRQLLRRYPQREPGQIETVDMARAVSTTTRRPPQGAAGGQDRGDSNTARRLFTRICVLHIRG